jgi:branched-chain amino acid transport system substrate-binding protein
MQDNKRATKTDLTRRKLLLAGTVASGAALTPRNFSLFTPAIAQSNPVRIGVLAPLSGVYASLGTNKVNGMRMLLGEKNNQVEGRPVQLIIEDTEAKPQEGLRKSRKLVEQDNVDVLLGVISSAIGYALKDYVARAKKVWVTTGAAADGIFKKANNTPYAYRASLSLWQANSPMGTWAAEKGFKRAFVTGPDYAMGREATGAFERAFAAKGATTAGEVFAPLGTNDFAPYLAEIKRVNPDVVYATYAGSDAVRFVQQYAAFGLKNAIPLAGFGYLVEEDTIPAQGDTVEGIYSGLNWGYGLDTSLNKAFVAKYREQYKSIPTVDSVAGYVGAQVVWEALKSLGGKVSNQETLSDALLKVKVETPRGPFSFDPETRNVIQNMYIRQAKKEGGEIHNAVVATFPSVRDPGV